MQIIQPQPDDWFHQGKFIPFDGLQIFTHKQGRGQPVLCLHAFPTSSYDYSRIAPFLSARNELIFLDYPGFGFSDKPARYPYSLFKYADAVEAVCKHFKLDSVWVCAHDIGDSIALELLHRKMLTVEKLVLLNGSVFSIPFTDPRMALAQKLWLNPLMGSLISGLRLFRKPMFATMFNNIFRRTLSPAEINAFWVCICHNNGLGIYHQLMGYMPERWRHQHAWLDALEKHPAPLTLIWGQADPVATPAVADHVLARRPDAQYIRLQGVGHYPHWDAPSVVADAVLAAFSR
jgi:pimeloyl-ACP methyl ester carboxylesterase